MKFIAISALLLALAKAENYHITSTYKVNNIQGNPACCYPIGELKQTRSSGSNTYGENIYWSGVYDSSEACKAKGIAGEIFEGNGRTDSTYRGHYHYINILAHKKQGDVTITWVDGSDKIGLVEDGVETECRFSMTPINNNSEQ